MKTFKDPGKRQLLQTFRGATAGAGVLKVSAVQKMKPFW
jgi:hypothetical protein